MTDELNGPKPDWTEPKQKQGEWFANREPPFHPDTNYHLHFLFVKGHWEWVLRGGRKSVCCGTTRCRIVTVKQEEN